MALGRFQFDREPLTPEFEEIARIELRETPEIRKEAVEELRKKIHEKGKLQFREDDDFLVAILRPCKFYPDSAYQLLEKKAAFRKKYAKVLENLKPEDETEMIFNYDTVNCLTNRDQKGRRILLLRIGGKWDPKKVPSNSLMRVMYMMYLAALEEPKTQVAGVIAIMDFESLGMKHVTAITPTFANMLLTFLQEIMALRVKAIHIVNQAYIFNLAWAILKQFVTEKYGKRIYFHGKDRTLLHQHISPSNLPADYGGLLPAIDYGSKDWYPTLLTVRDKIIAWSDYGYIQNN